jgi:hypothetical protein
MWRVAVMLLVFMFSLVSRPSHADAVHVVLVRPPAQDPIVSEAITRIRGELIADGFDVSVIDAPPGADPASVLSQSARPAAATATVGLFLRPDARAAEVWVVDRLTKKTVMRTIDLTGSPAGSAPEVLARRSVELLRASLLEVLVHARGETAAPSDTHAMASRWAERTLESRPSRWGLEAGAQVLMSRGGVGSAFLPVGRLRFGFLQRLAARLTLSGLGTEPRVESSQGFATVRQELGLLELVGDITHRSLLTPSVSLGAGRTKGWREIASPSPWTQGWVLHFRSRRRSRCRSKRTPPSSLRIR